MGKAQLFWRIFVLFCLSTFPLWCRIKQQLWDQDILNWVPGGHPSGQLNFLLKRFILVQTWFSVGFKRMMLLVAVLCFVKCFLLRNIGKEGKQFPNDCLKPNKTCEQYGSYWNEIAN